MNKNILTNGEFIANALGRSCSDNFLDQAREEVQNWNTLGRNGRHINSCSFTTEVDTKARTVYTIAATVPSSYNVSDSYKITDVYTPSLVVGCFRALSGLMGRTSQIFDVFKDEEAQAVASTLLTSCKTFKSVVARISKADDIAIDLDVDYDVLRDSYNALNNTALKEVDFETDTIRYLLNVCLGSYRDSIAGEQVLRSQLIEFKRAAMAKDMAAASEIRRNICNYLEDLILATDKLESIESDLHHAGYWRVSKHSRENLLKSKAVLALRTASDAAYEALRVYSTRTDRSAVKDCTTLIAYYRLFALIHQLRSMRIFCLMMDFVDNAGQDVYAFDLDL